MKKFKHKTTEWTAITHTSIPKSYRLEHDDELIAVPAELIENSQDWQEVIKDYEIIKCSGWNSVELKIHSVKRLSDGEVFRVGDWHRNEFIDPNGIKKDYEILTDRILEIGNSIWLDHEMGATALSRAIKLSRKPILTTEDGVELFEGDKHCIILRRDTHCHIYEREGVDEEDPMAYTLYFSTREAAEEYRLNNARLLSQQDIIDCISDASYPYIKWHEVKDLVKSRLK